MAVRVMLLQQTRAGGSRGKSPWVSSTHTSVSSSESDFHIANETRLLPRNNDDTPIKWADWKILARELLRVHDRDPDVVHPRFLRAELRLSRINIIHRFTRLPPLRPYLCGWHNSSSLFHDNLALMAAAAVFVVLVLTAMQVGLATERLQSNAAFQQASYGFTVFAILGPICAFGLVALGALFNLVNDLPLLIGGQRNRTAKMRDIEKCSTAGDQCRTQALQSHSTQ